MLFRTRLLIAFLALTVIPTTVIGTLNFYRARQSLRENKIASLGAIADLKVDKINTYFQERAEDIEVARKRSVVIRNLSILEESATPAGPEDQAARLELDRNIGYLQSVYGYYDIMLINGQGEVIYFRNRSRTYLKEDMPLSVLDEAAFEQAKDKIHFSEIYRSPESDRSFRMLLCAPVQDESGAFLGEIVFTLNMDPIYKFIQEPTGLGQTGETMLGEKAGEKEIMFLNPLRHDPHAALTRSVVIGGSTAVPTQKAASGESGEGISTDYRGKKVIAAWRPIPAMGWGLVVKMDADEAFAPVTDLARQTILIELAILLFGILLARLLARSLTRPILALKQGAAVIGSGNLDHKVGTAARDEIGDLSREFDRMTENLKKTIASRDELNREMEQRKLAQEALNASEVRYRRLFESAKDGILILDAETGKIEDVNPFLTNLLGYPHEQFVGTRLWELGFFKDIVANQDNFLKLQQEEYIRYRDLPLETADGRRIEVEFVSNVYLEDHKNVIQCNIRDITARKRSEASLKRLNRALRTISECNEALVRATDIKQLLDGVSRILVRNGGYGGVWVGLSGNGAKGEIRPAAQEGVSDEFLERINHAITAPEQAGCPIRRALLTGHDHFARDLANNPDCGECRELAVKSGFVSLAVLPLNAAGKTLGVLNLYASERAEFDDEEIKLLSELADDLAYGIMALRSQTESKSLQEQLLQSQKMEAIGRLAGGIAHDFNNMLTIILGLSEFLLKGFADGDKRREDVAEIGKAAERAASLTSQLLAFSRKQVIAPVVLDLSETVAGMDKMLRRVLGEDIAFATRLEPALGLCKADPGQVEQVILNLAVNARDAMPEGGKLTLETSNVVLDDAYTEGHIEVRPGPYVMMAVSDTGAGMDQETMDRIFEPFFTTKELGKGTGLGLSTVYGIVKQSGGHIRVYSEPGKGTSFKVYLPRIEEAGKEEARPAPVVESLQGSETVLLVEDDPQLKRLITRYLSRHGYDVITAGSGQEALKICASHPDPVHLLITDVVMPGMNGRELAEKLAASRPGIKVLYMSGYTDDHIVHHGVLDPGTHFIQKPFTATTLARKVREVLDA